MKAMRSSRRVRGVTLIELMISISIGLVVVAAVIVSFVGSGRAGRYQAALSQMNQEAQIGLNILSREVQLAGYVSPAQSLGTTPSLFGCDGTKGTAGTPFVDPAATAALTCGPDTGTTVSALEVVYEADIYNTVVVSALPTDCRLTTSSSGAPYIVHNRYFIDTGSGSGASGRPELYCASNWNAKQPLIENVEDMQIWYGIVAAANASQVIRYAKAGKDTTSTNTVNGQGAAEWNNVMSVRICLLMRSAEPILTGEDSVGYVDCAGSSQTSTDRYLRRAYFTTATARAKMQS